MKYILIYGIACVKEIGGVSEVVASVPDVTCEREEAERLVDLCNDLKLSPLQLHDVVEDLLEKAWGGVQ